MEKKDKNRFVSWGCSLDDETKDIIAKAYYNILHNVGNYGDLYNYDYYTALPEINNRVLKMKLRRENSK